MGKLRRDQGIDVDAQLEAARQAEARPEPDPVAEAAEAIFGLPFADKELLWGGGAKPSHIWHRDDGGGICYAGTVNVIVAPSNIGKTFLGIAAAREVLQHHGRVFWWNWDSDPPDIGDRLAVMGLRSEADGDSFQYWSYEMEAEQTDLVADWLAQAEDDALLVIDTLTAAGCDPTGGDILPWWKKHVVPFVDSTITVLLIDHPRKDDTEEDWVRGASGSVAKLTLPRGVVWRCFGEGWSIPDEHQPGTPGVIRMYIEKDKRGRIGPQRSLQAVARIGWDENDAMTWALTRPATNRTLDNTLQEIIADNPGLNTSELRTHDTVKPSSEPITNP